MKQVLGHTTDLTFSISKLKELLWKCVSCTQPWTKLFLGQEEEELFSLVLSRVNLPILWVGNRGHTDYHDHNQRAEGKLGYIMPGSLWDGNGVALEWILPQDYGPEQGLPSQLMPRWAGCRTAPAEEGWWHLLPGAQAQVQVLRASGILTGVTRASRRTSNKSSLYFLVFEYYLFIYLYLNSKSYGEKTPKPGLLVHLGLVSTPLILLPSIPLPTPANSQVGKGEEASLNSQGLHTPQIEY